MRRMIIGLLIVGLQSVFGAGMEVSVPKLSDVLTKVQEFNGFGCVGEDKSPEVVWKNAPASTKSFAVTVYDPDAPTGSGWWHWIVYNIPSDVKSLAENSGNANVPLLPKGSVQGRNDYGSYGFGGACPPKGDRPHRYIFTVFALDADKIDLPKEASAALIGYMLNSHAIEKSSVTLLYSR